MPQKTMDEELEDKLADNPVTAYIFPLSESEYFVTKVCEANKLHKDMSEASEIVKSGLMFMYKLHPDYFTQVLWFLHSAYVQRKTAPQIAKEVNRSVHRVRQILAIGKRNVYRGLYHAQMIESIRNESKTPLEDLRLSARAYNALRRSGINCLDDLIGYSQGDILKFRNIGKETAKEIISKAAEHGVVIS